MSTSRRHAQAPTATLALTLAALAVATAFAIAAPTAATLTEEERARASELFQAYRTAIGEDDRDAASTAIRTMIDELPGAAAATAHRSIQTDAANLARDWQREVEALLERARPRTLLRDPQVVADRALLEQLLDITDDTEQRRRLDAEGWPAIERLQAVLLPDPRDRIEADERLRQQRDAILFRLSLSDKLAAHAGLDTDDRLRARIEELQSGRAGLEAIATPRDRRVLTANARTAARGAVPERDVAGVADANRLRVLAGLSALELDPDLCKAALIHSEDMVEHGFFAHESPVPGRRTPWDRASEAGTTAHAENIAAGQRDPAAANRAWFHSPGHFRNLFGDFRRIGFGGHQRHWTQLFAR